YREKGGATDALAEVPTSRSHGADLVSLAVLVAVEARARLAIIVIGENPTGRAHGGHDLHRGGGVSAVALRPMHPMRTATPAHDVLGHQRVQLPPRPHPPHRLRCQRRRHRSFSFLSRSSSRAPARAARMPACPAPFSCCAA